MNKIFAHSLHSKRRQLLLYGVFSVTAFLTIFAVNTAKTSAGTSAGFNPYTDAGARDELAYQCTIAPPEKRTIFIIYVDKDRFSQTNDTATVYLKGMAHRCSDATKPATKVGLILDSISLESGSSTNDIGTPITFFSDKSVSIGDYTSPVVSGPYTLSTMTTVYNQLRYDYTGYSFNTSGKGWAYISFNAGDVCANIPGLQWPSVPAGLVQSGPNCIVPNTAPTGSFGITCNPTTFELTVTAYNVNDAEDNRVQVYAYVSDGKYYVDPPGVPGFYQYNEGTFEMGTTPGEPGKFYEILGKIRDSTGAEFYQDWSAANVTCPLPINTAPTGSFGITCNPTTFELTVTAYNVNDAEDNDVQVIAYVADGKYYVDPPGASGFYKKSEGTFEMGTTPGEPGKFYEISGKIIDSKGVEIYQDWPAANVTCPLPINTAPTGSFGITCNPTTFELTVTAYNVNDAEDNDVQVIAYVADGKYYVDPPGASGFYKKSEGTFEMGTTPGEPGKFYEISGKIIDSKGVEIYQDWPAANVTCPKGFTWITGAVRNAYDPDIGYAGETIETCNGPDATTDANGNFAFKVREGEGFCVRVTSNVAGAAGTQTRPRDIGYRGCGPFGLPSKGMLNASPNYCPATTTYENQVATDNLADGWDRATNDYYDIALRFKPQISCTVVSSTLLQPGVYRPLYRITNIGNSGRPALTFSSVLMNIRSPTLEIIGGQIPTTTSNQVINPGGFSIPDLNANTSYTWNITIPGNYNVGGLAGGSGDGLQTDIVSCGAPVVVGNKSFLKTYGGETWAGGSFPTTSAGPGYTLGQCIPPDNGRVYTYAGPEFAGAPTYKGSSSQFAVAAFLGITDTGNDAGYYSASARPYNTLNTWPSKGLTIANTGGGTYGSPSGMAQCMVDFYGKTVNSNITAQTTIPASFSTGMQRIMLSGDQTIGSLTINNNQQVAIYVDGDVYLNGNITFAGARTTAEQLPYFALIVRGNIYIDNDVTRLDGVFIAQPTQFIPDLGGVDTITKGTIYTCTQGSNVLYTNATIFNNCGNQLVVNGSLIGQNVRFLRTFGTLNEGSAGELPNFATGAGTRAAEVINYSPEQYLAPSPLKNPSDGTGDSSQDNYSSISTLPPLY